MKNKNGKFWIKVIIYLILIDGKFNVCYKFLQQTNNIKTVAKFLENKTNNMSF